MENNEDKLKRIWHQHEEESFKRAQHELDENMIMYYNKIPEEDIPEDVKIELDAIRERYLSYSSHNLSPNPIQQIYDALPGEDCRKMFLLGMIGLMIKCSDTPDLISPSEAELLFNNLKE